MLAHRRTGGPKSTREGPRGEACLRACASEDSSPRGIDVARVERLVHCKRRLEVGKQKPNRPDGIVDLGHRNRAVGAGQRARAAGREASAVHAEGLVYRFGDNVAVAGVDLEIVTRGDLRLPRSERRGQDDDDPDARDPATPALRHGARFRPRHRAGVRRGARSGEPHRAVRLGGRGPYRTGEPRPRSPSPRILPQGGEETRRRTPRRLRAHRGGGGTSGKEPIRGACGAGSTSRPR